MATEIVPKIPDEKNEEKLNHNAAKNKRKKEKEKLKKLERAAA